MKEYLNKRFNLKIKKTLKIHGLVLRCNIWFNFIFSKDFFNRN